ncbi:MAG: DUF2326 domain-containing protein [Methanosarcinaceae archaeon]
MRLKALSANKESFHTVKFNDTGLSIIVARQKNPGNIDNSKTYNGVGKSLIVALIHFCLGADKKKYKSFGDKLPGWIFTLEFSVGQETYRASRSTIDMNKIVLNNRVLSLKKFKNQMEKFCFDLPAEVGFLSFRSLLPFFIRPGRESYTSYNKPGKMGSEYQKQILNAHLLGLDVKLSENKYELKKNQERINTLTKNIKNDDLLKEFFMGDRDVTLAVQDLHEKIEKLENDLTGFQVAEDYYNVKNEADILERKLAETQNETTLMENQIKNIEESLKIYPDLDKDSIEKIYKEAQIIFSKNITKTLSQLENFYKQITQSRLKRLTSQKQMILRKLSELLSLKSRLEIKFDSKLKYLNSHQALDVFVNVNNQLSDLKNERDSLQKYNMILDEYHTQTIKIKRELLEAAKHSQEYLKEINELLDVKRDFFRRLAKRFYPDAASGITVYNNEGENQIRFDIEAKIESDSSDGINSVKIFCYDVTLLFKGFGHSIDFIFHDSRLFDGIDERQKTEIFQIANELFEGANMQYIATVNQNQLEEIKKYMTGVDFRRIITQNTILTLTDHSDSEKLLGIKVELSYE